MEKVLENLSKDIESKCEWYEFLIDLVDDIGRLEIFEKCIIERVKNDICKTYQYTESVSQVYLRLRALRGAGGSQYNLIIELVVYAFGKKYIYE